MSFDSVAWAWKQKGLSPSEKLVLIGLAQHSDRENETSFPSIGTLADECGLSERTLFRSLEVLSANGLIGVKNRKRPDGSLTSNLYSLNLAVILAGGTDTVSVGGTDMVAGGTDMVAGLEQVIEQGTIEQVTKEYKLTQNSWNSLAAPDGLERFHEMLSSSAYWNPKPTTWDQLIKIRDGKGFDFEEEAARMLAWIDDPTKNPQGRDHREITAAFVLAWFRRGAVFKDREAQNGRATQNRAGYLRPGRTLEEIEQSGGRVIRYDNTERPQSERTDGEGR